MTAACKAPSHAADGPPWCRVNSALRFHFSPRIAKNFPRRVVSGHAGDAATGVSARAAHVQALQRAAIVTMTEDRSRREELVKRERAVEDIAPDQSELALEVERRQCVPGDDARGKIGRVTIDGSDHQRFDRFFRGVPRSAVRQFRVRVLAKEARYMLAVRRE